MLINIGIAKFSSMCARLKTQIPMHSISLGCGKTVRPPPSDFNAYITKFSIHLEPGLKKKTMIIHFHTAENVHKHATVFTYF